MCVCFFTSNTATMVPLPEFFTPKPEQNFCPFYSFAQLGTPSEAKSYGTQHMLLRLTENWRRCLDENKIVGAVLTNLSKAFDCLPHELLIAKLDAYGFDENTIRLSIPI